MRLLRRMVSSAIMFIFANSANSDVRTAKVSI